MISQYFKELLHLKPTFPKVQCLECTSRIKANISSFLVITWHLYRKSHKTIWNVYVSNLPHSDKATEGGSVAVLWHFKFYILKF